MEGGREEGASSKYSFVTLKDYNSFNPLYSLLTYINTRHLNSSNYYDYLYHLLHRLVLFCLEQLREISRNRHF
jgi:hypothetical protein